MSRRESNIFIELFFEIHSQHTFYLYIQLNEEFQLLEEAIELNLRRKMNAKLPILFIKLINLLRHLNGKN
jgi:hypothetical protein